MQKEKKRRGSNSERIEEQKRNSSMLWFALILSSPLLLLLSLSSLLPSSSAATFGYVEDLDMDLDLDSMPFFSDISDVFENDVPSSSADKIVSTHLVSPGASETSSSYTSPSPSEENEFDDFFLPQQPFIMEENKPKASDASPDDFMDLIARLM